MNHDIISYTPITLDNGIVVEAYINTNSTTNINTNSNTNTNNHTNVS